MASDYGDEAGGKLLDWMLRIGQEAGAEAMARSARELSERLELLHFIRQFDEGLFNRRERFPAWQTPSTPGTTTRRSSAR